MAEKKASVKTGKENISNSKMVRTKSGKIKSTYEKDLRTEWGKLWTNKQKKVKGSNTAIKAFLKSQNSIAGKNAVGLVYRNDGKIFIKDLLTKDGKVNYIKNAGSKAKYRHNIAIDEVESKLKKNDRIISKLKARKNPVKLLQRPSREVISGGIKTAYVFRFVKNNEEFLENVLFNLERVFKAITPKHKNQKFIVRLSTTENALTDKTSFGVRAYGTPSLEELQSAIETKMEQALNNYDEDSDDLNFKTIGVAVITEPYNQILGAGGGGRSNQMASKSWFISNTYSRTNCFYRCIATHNILSQYNKENDLDVCMDEMLTEPQKFLDRVANAATNIKKRLKTHNLRATNEKDIIDYVNKCYTKHSSNKCEVKIYNNVFQLVKTIRPDDWGGEKLKTTYEIQNINHHFVALIRWYKVNNIIDILDEIIKIATIKAKEKQLSIENGEEDDENTLIDRAPEIEIVDWDKFNEFCEKEIWDKKECRCVPVDYENANKTTKAKYERWFKHRYGLKDGYCKRNLDIRNIRIGAYDLEATPNGVEGSIFVPYRLSFAYNVIDENTNFVRIKVVSFGGRDCITKWFNWLYENREILTGYTLYAHNGGKFDVMLLLSDYILKNTSKWVLEEGTLIVLNGAYLSFTLSSKEGSPDEIDSVSHNITAYNLKSKIAKKKKKDEDTESFLTFRDSMRLLPGGLKKLCAEFDVEHKKISEVVNFDEVNITNCFGGELNPRRPLADEKFKIELCNRVYCDYDVIGLLEILNKFSLSVYEACNGINITDCITGASLSKKHYFNTFYDYKTEPVWNLNNETDEFCRKSYYGGRCEAFYIGEYKQKQYYYDFTSLYPDVGRARLPYGEPKQLDKDRIIRWNERYTNKQSLSPIRGIVKVLCRTKDFDSLPLHAIKHEGKLTFSHFTDWTEMSLWYRELEYSIDVLDIYEYKLIDGIEFDGGHHTYVKTSYMNSSANKMGKRDKATFWDDGLLKEFFEDAVAKKALAKKKGQPALAQAYKIIANSGYGFWGLNANGDGEGRDGMSILKEDDDYFWELMAKDCVSNIGKIGDYILVRTAQKMTVKDFNVAIASAICSEARMKTYRFLKAVRDNGKNILYCDTDSCICDLKLNDYPEMMEEFCWDGNGEELGSMKNECLEKVEGYYKSKILKELGEDTPKSVWKPMMEKEVQKEIDKDDGELSFDKGIIAGCKQYNLKKQLIDGGFVKAGACKGVKRKLSYEEFQHLLYGTMMDKQRKDEMDILGRNPDFKIPVGYRIYEQQTQFRSSTSDHIAEGSFTEVRRIDIDKSVRINYTKGTIENEGWVKPFALNPIDETEDY